MPDLDVDDYARLLKALTHPTRLHELGSVE